MVLGVPFQFSSQFDSKLVILTEEEAAGIRASELFKFAERRNSDPMLPDSLQFMKHFSHSSSTDAQSPTRNNRSYSEDPDSFTRSTPLKYEEDTLLEHGNKTSKQNKQQEKEKLHHKDLLRLPSSSPSDILSTSPTSESSSFLSEIVVNHDHQTDHTHEALLADTHENDDHHVL